MPIPPYPRVFPKAILFDWDNTLVDSWESCFHATNAVFSHFKKKTLTIEEYFKLTPVSVRDFYAEWLIPEDAKKAETLFYHTLCSNNLHTLRPFSEAQNLLRWLFGKKIYVGVVSNKEGDILRQEVSHLGWGKYFSKVIGSRDAEKDKPSPFPILKALSGSDIEASHDVWFVGDSHIDMRCAQQAGCVPIGVNKMACLPDHKVVELSGCLELNTLLMELWEIPKA